MIQSMTAFAAVERNRPFGRLAWEIRSVNHRFLDLTLRLPEDFRILESDFRAAFAARVSRGKIDAQLRLVPAAEQAVRALEVNEPLARQWLAVHARLAAMSSDPAPVDLTALMAWPGVIDQPPADPEPLRQAARALLDEALESFLDQRRREGAALAAALSERLVAIDGWIGRIRGWLPEIREALRHRQRARLAELAVAALDEGRLETELALTLQKIDIAEELDRLAAHVAEGQRLLDTTEPVGRRFEFLLQEFHREANTLSSKSVDLRTTQASVDLRVLIEQMREQVQNVE